MNGYKATALQHHALGESLVVMGYIVEREAAQVWGKLVCSAIIGLWKGSALESNGERRVRTTRIVRLKEMVREFCSLPWWT